MLLKQKLKLNLRLKFVLKYQRTYDMFNLRTSHHIFLWWQVIFNCFYLKKNYNKFELYSKLNMVYIMFYVIIKS